jgi:hypothetical protein
MNAEVAAEVVYMEFRGIERKRVLKCGPAFLLIALCCSWIASPGSATARQVFDCQREWNSKMDCSTDGKCSIKDSPAGPEDTSWKLTFSRAGTTMTYMRGDWKLGDWKLSKLFAYAEFEYYRMHSKDSGKIVVWHRRLGKLFSESFAPSKEGGALGSRFIYRCTEVDNKK